jgi:hypothetical protein
MTVNGAFRGGEQRVTGLVTPIFPSFFRTIAT